MRYRELIHAAKQEFDAWDPILSMSERLCVRCARLIRNRSPYYVEGVCMVCTNLDKTKEAAKQAQLEHPSRTLKPKTDSNKYKKPCTACGRPYYRQGKCYRCFMAWRRETER